MLVGFGRAWNVPLLGTEAAVWLLIGAGLRRRAIVVSGFSRYEHSVGKMDSLLWS